MGFSTTLCSAILKFAFSTTVASATVFCYRRGLCANPGRADPCKAAQPGHTRQVPCCGLPPKLCCCTPDRTPRSAVASAQPAPWPLTRCAATAAPCRWPICGANRWQRLQALPTRRSSLTCCATRGSRLPTPKRFQTTMTLIAGYALGTRATALFAPKKTP